MKVLHITSANRNSGAGSAALNIQQKQREMGIDSEILFLKEEEDFDKGIYSYVNSFFIRIRQFIFSFLDRSLTKRYKNRKNELFSASMYGLGIYSHKLVKRADIIHLHWINHAFLSIQDIAKLNKFIVITMHDMWHFTGGCHQSYDCDLYKQFCGTCPTLGSSDSKDLSYKVIHEKNKHLSNVAIVYVAISTWMKDMANESYFLRNKVSEIVYSGINSNIFFYSGSKDKYRAELGLPQSRKIILTGAGDIYHPAKGGAYLIETLRTLESDVLVLNFGSGNLKREQLDKDVINLGFVEDKIQLAKYYQAADVFLSTSVAEAFGMTLAEAQCCGTPVVGFYKGGPIDIVENGKSGYLAEFKNMQELNKCLEKALVHSFDHVQISKDAVKKFSLSYTAAKYVDIYKRWKKTAIQ